MGEHTLTECTENKCITYTSSSYDQSAMWCTRQTQTTFETSDGEWKNFLYGLEANTKMQMDAVGASFES